MRAGRHRSTCDYPGTNNSAPSQQDERRLGDGSKRLETSGVLEKKTLCGDFLLARFRHESGLDACYATAPPTTNSSPTSTHRHEHTRG